MSDQEPVVTDELLSSISPVVDPKWEAERLAHNNQMLRQFCIEEAVKLENSNVGVQDHAIQVNRVISNANLFRNWILKND